MNGTDSNQGVGIDISLVLEEYQKQAVELSREIIFLKAYIRQLELKTNEEESVEATDVEDLDNATN